jgi:hypothetical protein
MCRMLAVTSDEYIKPSRVLGGLSAMKEGYDGSGIGIFMRDLGGPLGDMKHSPILSGIFSDKGVRRLDEYMLGLGFMTRYKISFRLSGSPPKGTPKRDIYLVRAYDYPPEWEGLDALELADRLTGTQLTLKSMGEEGQDMIVFSLWPDTVFIKEIGDPLDIADYLGLGDSELEARVVMAQGRQNTNYGIDLYACHPFFLQGFATMANGENTAFLPNRDFLTTRGIPGYNGYKSDSEVFTHTLHYTVSRLGLGLETFKHIITPLTGTMLETHPQAAFLSHLKKTCRQLLIDGPNCVIGCLPDNTVFMVQDSKKLRPGVVGGKKGTYAFSSEICGLDAVLPDRDTAEDYQPMYLDTVMVDPLREELRRSRQTDPLALPN